MHTEEQSDIHNFVLSEHKNTVGYYHPLERIITSHSLSWRIVTPSSLQPLPREITNPRNKVTCPPLLEYFIPYLFFRTIILVQLFASMVRVMVWEH